MSSTARAIYRLLPEGEKAWHAGVTKYNQNYAGVEIIARDDKDVNEKQVAAAGQLLGWHSQKYGYDPKTHVFGHGEISSNKEPDEERKVVTALRAGTLALSGGTAVVQGPKALSHQYWEIGRVKSGETQVAKAEPQKVPDYGRPPGRPKPSKQVAQAEPPAQKEEARPRAGSSAYWRGPQRPHQNDPAQAADEATRIASARSRGHAAGEGDADPNIPYAGSAMPRSTAMAAGESESSVEYQGGGAVPEKVVTNITVQARPTPT